MMTMTMATLAEHPETYATSSYSENRIHRHGNRERYYCSFKHQTRNNHQQHSLVSSMDLRPFFHEKLQTGQMTALSCIVNRGTAIPAATRMRICASFDKLHNKLSPLPPSTPRKTWTTAIHCNGTCSWNHHHNHKHGDHQHNYCSFKHQTRNNHQQHSLVSSMDLRPFFHEQLQTGQMTRTSCIVNRGTAIPAATRMRICASFDKLHNKLSPLPPSTPRKTWTTATA
jgi:hypothetical protein